VEEFILLSDGYVVYFLVFLALMGGAIGLPIPEDVPLVLAGAVVHSGNASASLMFLVCYSAILVGDAIIFLIGRRFGPALFGKAWFRRRFTASRMKRIRLSLERRSLLMIFVARHLFYLRTVTFLTCGAVKMRIARFLVADALAALISVPIMMSLGYFAAGQAEEILKNARNVSLWIGVLALVVIAILYIRHRKSADHGATAKDTTPTGTP